MSFRTLVGRWQGVLLSLLGIIATLWLGLTGQLALYIHPRYFGFSITMAAIAAVVVVAAFAVTSTPGHEHPEHEDSGHEDSGHENSGHGSEQANLVPDGGRWTWLLTAGSVAVIAAAIVGLLVLPPATLTSATVDQRDLNGSASTLTQEDASGLVGGDYSAFTVRDWASLLRQGAGIDFFADKKAAVTGFVTPDQSDPENVFFVARFVVACCAVDAQPIGIPVYYPGWQDKFKTDSWVTISSGFATNPSVASSEAIALVPDTITPADQPAQPYVY